MLNTEQIQSLHKLPSPILTAYLKIGPDDASKHAPAPSHLVWLKKEANSLVEGLPLNERTIFGKQLHRMEEFLRDRTPREKSIVIFAAPGTWEIVSLQIEVENSLHWGRAALSQLLWLADEHRPYCIVSVDRGGARFFGYRLREMSQLQDTKFDVDISQWKKDDLGHVARPGIQETYGTQRDVFEHRMDAQYRRLCRETAEQAIHLYRDGHFSAIFLVGPDRLIAPMAAHIPAELQRRVVLIKKDLGKFEPHGLQKHVEPEIEKWECEHELTLVNDLLGSERKGVTGIDETLAQLQKGKLRTLVLSRDLDARLHRCNDCGWTDSSADPVCSVCRGDRSDVTLRDVLPDLAAASKAEIEVVSGDAAIKLKEAGGIGAWLRQPKLSQLRRAAAQP